jgi:hypothetical protein
MSFGTAPSTERSCCLEYNRAKETVIPGASLG